MSFAVISIAALVALGVIAAVFSHFQGGNDEITLGHDCSSCTSADDGSCQLHCLIEEKKRSEKLKSNE